MIRPMMVMTTSISTSVKPRSPCRASSRARRWKLSAEIFFDIATILTSSDELRDRQQRGHNRDDQPTDDGADGDDGERPNDTYNTVEAALQFRFIEFGDPACQYR